MRPPNDGYVARDASGRPLASSREVRDTLPGGYALISGRVLLRIEGPRSAWDHIEILHRRHESGGRLCVRTIEWWEREGVYVQ